MSELAVLWGTTGDTWEYAKKPCRSVTSFIKHQYTDLQNQQEINLKLTWLVIPIVKGQEE